MVQVVGTGDIAYPGWQQVLSKLGSELTLLQDSPLEEIEQVGGTLSAEAIRWVRTGEVTLASATTASIGRVPLKVGGASSLWG